MRCHVSSFLFLNEKRWARKSSISFALNFNRCYFSCCGCASQEASACKPESDFNNTGYNNFPNKNSKFDNKWKKILGRTGPNRYSHIIAFQQLKSAKPVTASKINDILAYCNITITDEKLKYLLNTPSFLLMDLNNKKIKANS